MRNRPIISLFLDIRLERSDFIPLSACRGLTAPLGWFLNSLIPPDPCDPPSPWQAWTLCGAGGGGASTTHLSLLGPFKAVLLEAKQDLEPTSHAWRLSFNFPPVIHAEKASDLSQQFGRRTCVLIHAISLLLESDDKRKGQISHGLGHMPTS